MAEEQREGPEKEKIYTFTERNCTLHLHLHFLFTIDLYMLVCRIGLGFIY